MYGALQWGCTWYALFFRSDLRYTRAALGEAAQCRQCQRQQLCPAFSTIKPDSIACVLRAGAVQIMQDPGRAQGRRSLARGASSLASVQHPVSQSNAEPSAGSGATAHRRRRIPRTGMDPTP